MAFVVFNTSDDQVALAETPTKDHVTFFQVSGRNKIVMINPIRFWPCSGFKRGNLNVTALQEPKVRFVSA